MLCAALIRFALLGFYLRHICTLFFKYFITIGLCTVNTGSAKLHELMMEHYANTKTALQQMLLRCRKVTLCLDGWSAKGLASSYLGVSACFFDSVAGKPAHATLNLHRLPHPHTGAAIAEVLDKCLQEWDITASKVQLIVTDNGANVVKAVKILQDREILKLQTKTLSDDESQTEDDENSDAAAAADSDDDNGEVENKETNEEDNDSDTEELIDLPDVVPY